MFVKKNFTLILKYDKIIIGQKWSSIALFAINYNINIIMRRKKLV